eukprot:gene9958-biopygen18254
MPALRDPNYRTFAIRLSRSRGNGTILLHPHAVASAAPYRRSGVTPAVSQGQSVMRLKHQRRRPPPPLPQ